MSGVEVPSSVVDEPRNVSTETADTSPPGSASLGSRNMDEAALYVFAKCHHVEIPSH